MVELTNQVQFGKSILSPKPKYAQVINMFPERQ